MIIVITGDPHEAMSRYRSVRAEFFGDSPEQVIEALDPDRVHAELMSGSLFGGKKLVYLDSALFDAKWLASILKWAPMLDGRSDRMLVVRDVAKPLDRRRLAKLKKAPGVELVHFSDLKTAREAMDFAYSYMSENGFEADPGAVELLVKIVGHDRGVIASEIDKLMSAAQRLTMKYVANCAFPSSGETVHFKLYSALADGDEIEARAQAAQMTADGIPPLAVLASMVKLLATTMAGPETYDVEQNELNEGWIGTGKPKKVSKFMANIYHKIFERMGERRILNTIAQSGDSIAVLRLSMNPDMETTRVDHIIGEICRE